MSNLKNIPIYRDDFLRTLRPSKKKYEIMTLDTEDDSQGRFILACIRYKNEIYIFYNQPLAHKWLIEFAYSEEAKKTLLVAHNLAYDIVNMLWPFYEDIELIINGTRVLMGKIGNLLMYDTFNHSFCSLAVIGDVIGLKKLEFNPNSEEYVTRDVDITHKYAEYLQDMYLSYGVDFPLSLASGALRIWRTNFQKGPIRCLHSDLIDVIRPAYYGGRVEAFRLGEVNGQIWYYDVNSMYPFVMREKYTDVNSLSFCVGQEVNGTGIIYARVEAPKTRIPVLPYRLEDGRTLYGYGKWKGWYTSIELDYAESQGYHIERLYGFVSVNKVYPFREFVDYFYQKRLSAKSEQEKLFFKLIMNSLYGKFGTGREKHILKPYTAGAQYDNIVELFLGKYALEVDKTDYPLYSNLWAYEVTAYARILLHRLMVSVEKDLKGELLYCDTDSIIYCGGRKMLESKDLGQVKCEGKADCIEIMGAKEYIFKQKAKAKGIPKPNQEEYLRKGHTTFQKPIRLMEGLRRGIRPNIWVDVTKWKSTPYYKRKVLNDGTTETWRIDNEREIVGSSKASQKRP